MTDNGNMTIIQSIKKLIVLALALAWGSAAMAQQGNIQSNVRDTFEVVAIHHNGDRLTPEEWPATFVVEDSASFTFGSTVYRKEQSLPVRVPGYSERYDCEADVYRYEITNKGRKREMGKVVFREEVLVGGIAPYAVFIVDKYDIYVAMKTQ